MNRTGTIAWRKLVELEPRLEVLYHDILNYVEDDYPSTSMEYWHNEVKPAFWPLVGWGRADCHPVLRREQAYAIAYHTLHDLLQSRVRAWRSCQP